MPHFNTFSQPLYLLLALFLVPILLLWSKRRPAIGHPHIHLYGKVGGTPLIARLAALIFSAAFLLGRGWHRRSQLAGDEGEGLAHHARLRHRRRYLRFDVVHNLGPATAGGGRSRRSCRPGRQTAGAADARTDSSSATEPHQAGALLHQVVRQIQAGRPRRLDCLRRHDVLFLAPDLRPGCDPA